MACCHNKFPVASLIAAILQSLGLSLFCSSSILGFNESLNIFKNNVTLYEKATDIISDVDISIYCLTALTITSAVLFLFEAFLVTAQNSEQLYDDGQICCTSLGCVTASIVSSGCLLFLWVAITAACALLFTFAMMLSNYYDSAGGIDEMTIDLRYYGFMHVGEITVENPGGSLVLYFSLAVSGAALVTLGLACSVACMTSNWVHLKDGKKWKKYAHQRKQEERELHEMTSYKSSERLAQSLYY